MIDKALDTTSPEELQVEGWYEMHFLFHFILRKTPSLARGSKWSTAEMVKKADERIH